MSRLLVVWLMEKGGEKGGRTDARLPRIGIPFPLVQVSLERMQSFTLESEHRGKRSRRETKEDE